MQQTCCIANYIARMQIRRKVNASKNICVCLFSFTIQNVCSFNSIRCFGLRKEKLVPNRAARERERYWNLLACIFILAAWFDMWHNHYEIYTYSASIYSAAFVCTLFIVAEQMSIYANFPMLAIVVVIVVACDIAILASHCVWKSKIRNSTPFFSRILEQLNK